MVVAGIVVAGMVLAGSVVVYVIVTPPKAEAGMALPIPLAVN